MSASKLTAPIPDAAWEKEFADPFYAAIDEGRLVFPRCHDCSRFHWYPQPRCPHCLSKNWQWQPVSSTGRLFTWTRVEHLFDPDLADVLPLTIALVEFDEAPGVRLVTRLTGHEAVELDGGVPLTLQVDTPAWSTRSLPVFTPA